MRVENSTTPPTNQQPSQRRFIPIWEKYEQEEAARDPEYKESIERLKFEATHGITSRSLGEIPSHRGYTMPWNRKK